MKFIYNPDEYRISLLSQSATNFYSYTDRQKAYAFLYENSVSINPAEIITNISQHNVLSNNVCIFAHYDVDSIVDDYVIYYLSSIHRAGYSIVFVSSCPSLDESSYNRIKAICASIITRKSIGRDFLSWKIALDCLGDLSSINSLILANDSVYGPFDEMAIYIEYMRSQNYDICGFTDNTSKYNHIQSYFMYFSNKFINSNVFKDFWAKFIISSDKEFIIDFYEIGLSYEAHMGGYKLHALCNYDKIINILDDGVLRDTLKAFRLNPTHHLWDILIEKYGFPFIKIELIRDNPSRVNNLGRWKEVLESKKYDNSLIYNHIGRTTTARHRLYKHL